MYKVAVIFLFFFGAIGCGSLEIETESDANFRGLQPKKKLIIAYEEPATPIEPKIREVFQTDKIRLQACILYLENRLPIEKTKKRFLNIVESAEIVHTIPDRFCKLLVLPSDWATSDDQSYEKAIATIEFSLAQGIPVLVFQPNPYRFKEQKAKISLFGEAYFEVENDYMIEDGQSISNHIITKGIQENELPFPADRIIDYSDHFSVIVVGKITRQASAIVGVIKGGKIAVITDHPECPYSVCVTRNGMSDRYLYSQIKWLISDT